MDKGQEEKTLKKGAGSRVIGAVLVSLALINILLNTKSNSAPDPFYFIMASIGAVFIAAGSWRSRKG
ncbi:MAG TPA: hypothetical protein DDW94_05565 [Deltaproteobacteria bacterium]|nr:MAG: hypothetical protein A2Z79_04380 [Deltaproteobacteria bacterium GWA2_55_82]OGQ64161.1 MAG: hypothetical protein A3I81_10765 [Deltaproteobacteria bacterium RIFCSPLOWO2_02_FULL_55_12]OIJ74614.1 MAG: hypothetical protein A2V21_310290 [Deltaproteobacteria bacterium GWC2_55_46]HBG46442.1 hypothetical protein [Deltaproteobacteria bacterium]HCY10654.1 hypothetical protein [Deltaproteobacteria bacterium]